MAVVDAYVNSDVANGELTYALYTNGTRMFVMRQQVDVAAADDDGSVYRVFKAIDDTLIPIRITIATTAITGGTDYDLGIYITNLGAVVTKDLFMDGQTMASASQSLNGLSNITTANLYKNIYELAGKTAKTRIGKYDLCLTANTVGTAAGTIVVTAEFAQK